MPATYAHYRFGQEVYRRLPSPVKTLVDRYPDLFMVGLHGPDILFHYHPFQAGNPVIQCGHKLHRQSAAAFFQMAEYALPDDADRNAGIAYLLGFFCHFMLDSACHPLVREAAGKDSVRHNQTEIEMDRFLMRRQGLDPLRHNPTRHLHLNRDAVRVVARFYPGLSEAQIARSVRGMRRLLSLLVVPGKRRKEALTAIARRYRFHGLVMQTAELTEYAESSQKLADCLDETVAPTALLLIELAERLLQRQPVLLSDSLSAPLARHFG